MEEEEVLIDPKDPFAKYGGKQVSVKETTTDPDPFAKYGGKLKKKEPTVSEPDSNDGSTQAGLDVSQEPGPKGAQPSGKSTEEDNEYTRYFNAYQEKLGKQYTNKLNQELVPYDQALATQPDTSDQKSVDEYNQKVEVRNAFAKKRSKELDDEFNNTVNTEYQRVKGQAEGFEKALGDFRTKYQTASKEIDWQNRERNPFVTAWTTAKSTLTQDLPSSAYGTKALMGSAFNKFDESIDSQFGKIDVNQSTKEKATGFIEKGLKSLLGEEFNLSDPELKSKMTEQEAGRKLVFEDLKKAIDLSDKGAEVKANLTNSLEKAKGGDFVDYLN